MPREEIIAIDCELSAYRKGSIAVHLNLQQGYLTWKDSKQWCNNFIRSLTEEQVRSLRDLLSDSEMLNRGALLSAEAVFAPEPARANKTTTVQLTVLWPDRQIMLAGEDLDPEAWKSLCMSIEKLSRVPFRL
jgi:hypothetical protein